MKLKLSQADMEKTFKSMLDTYKVMAPVKNLSRAPCLIQMQFATKR